MNINEISTYLDHINKHHKIGNEQNILIKFLANDNRVNKNGVYNSGVERLCIDSKKITSEIRVVEGRNNMWFYGLSYFFKIPLPFGVGFSPSLSQIIEGKEKYSRKEALIECVEALRKIAELKLSEYPDLLIDLYAKIEDFNITHIYEDVTYGLPLFADV